MRSTRSITPGASGSSASASSSAYSPPPKTRLELAEREESGSVGRISRSVELSCSHLRREPGARRQQQRVERDDPERGGATIHAKARERAIPVHSGQGPSTSTESIWPAA